MPGEYSPDVRPLVSQKSLRIIWRSFEYYSPLKRLLGHVRENPDKPLSLGQAAAIASLDYTHFAEYFRQKTGVTYKYWIDFMRISRAARLLESEDTSITEAAQESGFGDLTTFCRTFRRVLGMTPIQFRSRRKPGALPQGTLVKAKAEESPKSSEELPENSEEPPRL